MIRLLWGCVLAGAVVVSGCGLFEEQDISGHPQVVALAEQYGADLVELKKQIEQQLGVQVASLENVNGQLEVLLERPVEEGASDLLSKIAENPDVAGVGAGLLAAVVGVWRAYQRRQQLKAEIKKT